MQKLSLLDGVGSDEANEEEDEQNDLQKPKIEIEPEVTPEIFLHATAGGHTPQQ